MTAWQRIGSICTTDSAAGQEKLRQKAIWQSLYSYLTRVLVLQSRPASCGYIYIPLLGGCYGKSCKLNGQHTRARNHSAISRVVIALHKLLHRGPGLMIFITALSKRNGIHRS